MHHVNTFLTLALWAAPTHKAIAVFFCSLQDRGDLRPAVCELRSFYGAPLAMTSPVTLVAPFFVSAWAQASKVAPVVKMSSTRRMCFPWTGTVSLTAKASWTFSFRSSRQSCHWTFVGRRRCRASHQSQRTEAQSRKRASA